MSKLAYLQNKWRNFAAERREAELKLRRETNEISDQIKELTALKQSKKAEFVKHWSEKKLKTRQDLDDEALREIAKGRTVQDILREMGSNNTVWAYDLRKDFLEGKTKLTPPVDDPNAPVEDANIQDLFWEHSDHEGVHGILVDTHRNYFKKYGDVGTPFEGEWFIADMEHTFVAGNKKLWEHSKVAEMTKRVSMLTRLLDGEYKGKLKISPNKYKN